MSHLILDIGNSRAKAAIIENGMIEDFYTADSIQQLAIADLCSKHNVDAAIASVVGTQPDFKNLLPPRIYARFHQLSHKSVLPITIDYDTPDTLGMDRIAAVIGARVACPYHPLLVVDAGTCITVDLLDGHNHYHGGAILPGIQMKLHALHDHTAALPLVSLTPEELEGSEISPSVGKSTRASIVAGVCNASLFEIQGFIDEYRKKHPSLKLFLTGGDSVFFAKRLFFPNFANPSLIMFGLNKILEMNI